VDAIAKIGATHRRHRGAIRKQVDALSDAGQ